MFISFENIKLETNIDSTSILLVRRVLQYK